MRNDTKYKTHSTRHSSFWQALEYRKRLMKLIEQGLSIDELDKQSDKLFKELNDGQCN
ncbi:hypothetical protein [Rodentibacter haemolyticus]|uniref:Uncharacterized protein n=1 Tax=Rodentibacter haemolyticus TaxID=2778911 RepID=A0ABX6UWQ1_9PAST|nr:hypothetical protein [Rodentibacter haemolyticus]QPB42199.1 hypothetical protein IHV77_09825 [Rodentibacter haemolyticus]